MIDLDHVRITVQLHTTQSERFRKSSVKQLEFEGESGGNSNETSSTDSHSGVTVKFE